MELIQLRRTPAFFCFFKEISADAEISISLLRLVTFYLANAIDVKAVAKGDTAKRLRP